jgi:IPT/TIG domain-containing protein
MTIPARRRLTFAAFAVSLALGAVHARSGFAAPPRPTILGVRSDLAADKVTITGTGFGVDTPQVTLGGIELVVDSSTDDTIVAALPAGVAGANHLLVVGSGNRSDSRTVWIPGEGIVTRNGIRIESTELDVNVIAGASRITVDHLGKVTIRASGDLEINAGGSLDLRGNAVSIRSGSGMTVNAGTALNLSSSTAVNANAPTVNVTGQGLVNVVGGVVRIN